MSEPCSCSSCCCRRLRRRTSSAAAAGLRAPSPPSCSEKCRERLEDRKPPPSSLDQQSSLAGCGQKKAIAALLLWGCLSTHLAALPTRPRAIRLLRRRKAPCPRRRSLGRRHLRHTPVLHNNRQAPGRRRRRSAPRVLPAAPLHRRVVLSPERPPLRKRRGRSGHPTALLGGLHRCSWGGAYRPLRPLRHQHRAVPARTTRRRARRVKSGRQTTWSPSEKSPRAPPRGDETLARPVREFCAPLGDERFDPLRAAPLCLRAALPLLPHPLLEPLAQRQQLLLGQSRHLARRGLQSCVPLPRLPRRLRRLRAERSHSYGKAEGK